MQAILCVSTSISGVYGIKITAENRDSDLLCGYLGRSAEFRTLGLVVPNHARYQLRHTPIVIKFLICFAV